MRSPEHNLFFAGRFDGNTASLDAEETRHAISVLRMKPGDRITMTDGSGWRFSGTIPPNLGRDGMTVAIVERVQATPLQPALTIFAGMPERGAFEEMLVMLVLLGVAAIVPVVCAYCQKNWWEERWEKLSPRFRTIMVTALKQSHNCLLPALHGPKTFTQAVDMADAACLVADMDGQTMQTAMQAVPPPAALSCFIGPPGGFSPEELQTMKSRGSAAVRLSPNRLKTELAAVVAAACILQPAGRSLTDTSPRP